MLTQPEWRRESRITVPQNLRGGEPEHHLVHVLSLSRLGARIAHREPLQAGGVWYVDLPPELGDLRLTARVVWTRLLGTERMMEGARRRAYESGIEFTGPTAEQQTALAAVLATLQAETPTPDRCRPHEAPSPDARASPGIPTPDQQNGLLRVGHHAPAAMDHAVTGAVDGMSPP